LDILFHQIFLERVIKFFQVKVEDEIAYKAMDKLAEIKTNTQKSLSNAMEKRNIITLNIDARKIIIPLNRYNIQKSKWLVFEIGQINLKNIKTPNSPYKERNDIDLKYFNLIFYENLKDLQNEEKKFQIIYDTKFKIGVGILPKGENAYENASIKLFIEINNVKFQLTDYTFAMLCSLGEILR
jgi:hypothetical protein